MSLLDDLLGEIGPKLVNYLPVIVLPFIVLLIWLLFFFNGSPLLTQLLTQLGLLFLAIPLIVIIFLSVPVLAFGLFLGTTQYIEEFAQIIIASFFVFTFIIQYFYIRRIIDQIEEKEKMPFLAVLKREFFDKEYRRQIQEKKKKRVEETRGYFDQITVLNKEKKEQEKMERERLRKVLMGEYDKNQAETEQN